MEKPIRIVENEKIRTFNEKIRAGLEHALNFMLGTDGTTKIQIGAFDAFTMPMDAYLNFYKKKSVMIKVHSSDAYTGEFYWFFEINTAVALGCLMRMMPPAVAEERIKAQTFDETDQDSFGEVGNQLCGILDRAFRTLTHKKIHLRMDFHKKVYPNDSLTIDTFLNNEEYIVLLCPITLPNLPTQKISLLLPVSLYEVLLNLEIELHGITPRKILFYSPDSNTCEKIQTELNSRYIKVVIAPKNDEVFKMLDLPGIIAAGIEYHALTFPFSMPDNIYLKRLISNRNLMRMPYFFSWSNPTQPVLVELFKLGLKGANMKSINSDFTPWVKSIVAALNQANK